MYEAAASCKDLAWAPVTNWEPQGVTLVGYGYTGSSGVPRNFVRGWGQQIQLRAEDREKGDLGAVAA